MKYFETKEIKNNKEFDLNDIVSNAPFTQAYFYGDWQEGLGGKTRRFLVYCDKEIIAYFQLIKYPLVFGKNYMYVPYGPIIKDFSEELLGHLKKEISTIAKKENAVFVRLDFTPSISNNILSNFFSKALFCTYHSANFQPRTEWFLGLKKTKDELLAQMHEKTRYSIRLSGRKGIISEIITKDFEEYFEVFYDLMIKTAKRNNFSLHKKSYYSDIFRSLSEIENAYLSIARYGQTVLTVDLIIVSGGIANYVFGGSSNEEKNRMPTYSAHWKAIGYAKQLNCSYYNFGAVSSEEETYKGWDGLTVFKKKFGGKEVKHSDFFDLIVSPLWYYFYNLRKRFKK